LFSLLALGFAGILFFRATTVKGTPQAGPNAFADSLKGHTVKVAGLPTPAKLCSSINTDHWRDSIVVGQAFTVAGCSVLAGAIGADSYQLGCINKDSISFSTAIPVGNLYANFPPTNQCGWKP